MVDLEKAPPVPSNLVSFLEEALTTNVLLEEGPSEGLERLGFIKGARYVLNFLRGLNEGQNDVF